MSDTQTRLAHWVVRSQKFISVVVQICEYFLPYLPENAGIMFKLSEISSFITIPFWELYIWEYYTMWRE